MSDLDPRRLAFLGLLALVAVLLGARLLTPGGAPASGGAAAVLTSTGATAAPTTTPGGDGAAVVTTGGQTVTVHVAGAVRRPGVYRLAEGRRVDDAVRAAGGATARADLAAVNLAAVLEDGRQVLVPRRVAAGTAVGASTPAGAGSTAGTGAAAAPVSLSTATEEQLDGLDGVGPATARKILAYRDEHGGFGSVDELAEVPGIGPKKLEALRELVVP